MVRYMENRHGAVGDLMVSECGICGAHLGEEYPQMNGMCIDCLADNGGK